MVNWKDIVVTAETPLREAIARIDASGIQVALVLDGDGRLAGTLTDGDIRRAILRGESLQIPAGKVMNPHATAIPARTPREEMLAVMRQSIFHHLPLLDEGGRVTWGLQP